MPHIRLAALAALAATGTALAAAAAPTADSMLEPAAAQADATPRLPDKPDEGRGLRLRYGARDTSARRGSPPVENPFAPFDLPTPTEARLASGAPGPAYWQQRVDFAIDAAVDVQAERLTASATITYHNNSPHPLDYLWLQLEQNLFNPASEGARAFTPAGGVVRGEVLDFPGGYDISAVTDAAGQTLPLSVYDTLARLDPPRPIAPGEVFTFRINWAFNIPPYHRRMGAETVARGKILEFAQWFPNLCVYDDVHGWNTLPYLGNGEFYTNFGDYTLNVTAPEGFVVVASGELTNPADVLPEPVRDRLAHALTQDEPVWIVNDAELEARTHFPAGEGTRTWRFNARDVRTVAFAVSDAWVWDACGATVTTLDGTAKRVLCQSVYPQEAPGWYPGHKARGSTKALRHAVEFYSGFAYPYPYSVMTNVNGPEDGMEYPMIVFCGDRDDDDGPFGVTDHEVGHTWFPMLVNNDERRHVWMDEGFNSFMNIYSAAKWNDKEPDFLARYRRRGGRAISLADNPQAILTPPDQMWPGWLGYLGYGKPALGLAVLRELVLGHDRFDAAFKAYVRRWAYKSPRPADFFRSMEDAAGMDLTWFWRSWFEGTGVVDFAVTEAANAHNGKHGYATIEMRGDIPLPVPLRATLADGRTIDHTVPAVTWAVTKNYRAVFETSGVAIESVEIAPDVLFPDINPEDNTWKRPSRFGP